MKGITKPVVILFAVLFIFGITTCLAEESTDTQGEEKFVDRDGDGIRDNASDTDGDGIPDFDRQKTEEEPPELAGLISFGEAGQNFETAGLMTNRDNFKLRKFSCRGQTASCGEFGSGDFGPGQGVSGAVSGACAGGICY